MATLDLLKDNPKGLFKKYLLASISATLVTSIYIITDTVMIGHGVGANGIAALNLILPLFSILYGTGMLFGVGGGVLFSISSGSGDIKKGKAFFTMSLCCVALLSVIALIFCNLYFEPLLRLLGVSNENMHLASDYARFITLGSPLFIFSTFLQAFVRNDRAPKRAMQATIVGGICNVVLDYIFIFPLNMGMGGAALATLIGTAATVLVLLSHFLSKKNNLRITRGSLRLTYMKSIFKCGLPSFLLEIAAGFITLFFNWQILAYIGENGLIVYSIISNLVIISMSLFNGVAQAAQPIMAINFGAKAMSRVFTVRSVGLRYAFFIGLGILGVGLAAPRFMVTLFVSNPPSEVFALAEQAIRIYFIAFLFQGANIFYSTYFQSIIATNASLIISLLRGMLLGTGLVFLLPAIFPPISIWFVVPLAELLTLLCALYLRKRIDRNVLLETPLAEEPGEEVQNGA